jgi:RNA polymerase sigma-70 factor (ECF subfamily)
VWAALAQLGEDYRVVVILRFYQGFSLQEIADLLVTGRQTTRI